MADNSSNNKRIAKNTIYLYLRMFVTMAVGLFTSRIVLQTLGIEDYGVYNIVGGVVVLFSFISNALRNATQRYLSYELGKSENADVNKVFNMSIQCHVLICIIILVLAETVGLWFTTTQLNIPEGREIAVQYVYQFTVITFVIHVMQVPYNSAIIAYERMSFYAIVSIVEAVLKLVLVSLLIFLPWDALILYSILVAFSALVVISAYAVYCYRCIKLDGYRMVKDKDLFKGLTSFSVWSMMNGCATLFAQQGGNYFINVFSGVAANAAFGIANQVSSLIYGFVSNFQSAFQPQIVKQFASKQREELNTLLYRTSSLSYYLLLIISIPFAFEADYMLQLWLGIVPENASLFCILLLIYFLLDSMQAPLWMLIYGTGEIKNYTIITGLFTLANLPFAWLLLHFGFPIYSIFIVRIILNIFCSAYRLIYVNRHIQFPSINYLVTVGLRALIVMVSSLLLTYGIANIGLHPLVVIILSMIITAAIILLLGLSKNDKTIVKQLIINKIRR